jgi:hypothetical protein
VSDLWQHLPPRVPSAEERAAMLDPVENVRRYLLNGKPRTVGQRLAAGCHLRAHHTHEPGVGWGYGGPDAEFRATHLQCRCKGCGLYVIWIRR